MKSHARRFAASLLLATLWCLAGPGCAPKPQPRLSDEMGLDVSAQEFDARLIEYANSYIGRVEHVVRDVLDDTKDPEIRRGAMIWAIRTNEDVVRASFYRDPVAVLIDLWALSVQNRDFAVKRANDPDAPRPYIDWARELTIELEQEIEAIAMEFGGEEIRQSGQRKVHEWARNHPITGDMHRTSTAALIAKIAPDAKTDLFNTLGDMNDSIVDVSFRLDVMTNQLPKQFVWHAAMLTDYYLGTADIPELIERADTVLEMVQDVPATVATEREAVLADIDRQRIETLAEIDRQRIALTADINTQREETLAEIATLARESFQVVDAQGARLDDAVERTTQELTAALDAQREAALDQIDATLQHSVAEPDGAVVVIDHMFWRLLQFGALVFVAAIVLIVLLTRLWPRP